MVEVADQKPIDVLLGDIKSSAMAGHYQFTKAPHLIFVGSGLQRAAH